MTETKNAAMRLIELGVKEGILVKGELPIDTEKNLDVLLSCVDAVFADFESLDIAEVCQMLIRGLGCLERRTYDEDSEDFVGRASDFLEGLNRGGYLSRFNLWDWTARTYPLPLCKTLLSQMPKGEN